MRVLAIPVMLLLHGCVQLQIGNDVVDAASAVATGVYLQKQQDQAKAKSVRPDPFKKSDPTVKKLDAAIEKARSRTQPTVELRE